jgi:ubiquinone/menaquinone biosynthesis C-methylase UbiE
MALKRRARRIIEELNPQDGDKILDVGCGDGYYLYLLSNLGLKLNLWGVDNNKRALGSAAKNLSDKNIKLVNADLMQKLPFDQVSFDKAVMSEVAEHLPNDQKGLREVKRVLKKSGVLVLSVPNQNYPFFWDPINWILERLIGRHIKSGFWAGIWNQHLRLYKPQQISSAIKMSGFKIEKVESLTFWCLPFNHNLVNLVARGLYGGSLSSEVSESVSKFRSPRTRPFWASLAFKFVNMVDKLNDFYSPMGFGVAVIVKAVKQE